MAGLLRQLHYLSVWAVSHIADQGDAFLQVHLQGQQAVAAPVCTHHGCMHALQLSANRLACHPSLPVGLSCMATVAEDGADASQRQEEHLT